MFWCMWTKSLLHWCKRGLHWWKTGLHWCKTLSDHLSSSSKHLMHPLLTTLGTFEVTVSDHYSRRFGSQIGFGKRGLLEKGSFQKSPFSRDSREFRDSRDFGEPPDCGNKGKSDHFLETLENLEILEILEIRPAKRPIS